MREITQAVPDKYAIKGRVGEGKAGGVRTNDAILATRPRSFEHRQSEIGGNRFRGGRKLRDNPGEITRAACQVKHPRIFRQRRAKNSFPLPAAIHTEGKSAGDEIIFWSNAAEHTAHELRIVFFGGRLHERLEIVSDAMSGCSPMEEANSAKRMFGRRRRA